MDDSRFSNDHDFLSEPARSQIINDLRRFFPLDTQLSTPRPRFGWLYRVLSHYLSEENRHDMLPSTILRKVEASSGQGNFSCGM